MTTYDVSNESQFNTAAEDIDASGGSGGPAGTIAIASGFTLSTELQAFTQDAVIIGNGNTINAGTNDLRGLMVMSDAEVSVSSLTIANPKAIGGAGGYGYAGGGGGQENKAVTLEATDIDWNAKQIGLTRTKTNRPRTLDWKTPGGDASVVLAHAPRQGALFPASTGAACGNFAAKAVRVSRNLAGRDATFKPFRVHDLRLGFAIRWLRRGVDIYHLSIDLGHTSVKTTEIYLGHLSAREQAGAQKGTQRGVSGANSDAAQIEKM
jgi:hypothetical protein